jgi:hypothetical protein
VFIQDVGGEKWANLDYLLHVDVQNTGPTAYQVTAFFAGLSTVYNMTISQDHTTREEADAVARKLVKQFGIYTP